MPTGIDYVDEVWNPITGCLKEFRCWERCWARALAGGRLKGRHGYPDDKRFTPTFHENRLTVPLKWKTPKTIFVSSMGDMFSSAVPHKWFAKVIDAIEAAPQHTYIFLTKRPKSMLHHFDRRWRYQYYISLEHWFDEHPNLWLGVSASTQPKFDERVKYLLKISAAVRFVSLEPLGEEVNVCRERCPNCGGTGSLPEHPDVACQCEIDCYDCGGTGGVMPAIDWVIVGCESGPGHRPMDEDWVRDIRDKCEWAGVPLFFKQACDENGKLVKMPKLDGVGYAQFPISNDQCSMTGDDDA